jgi:hypothetical protein
VEKKSVGLLELETAVLECFLEKTPLSPLGVKKQFIVSDKMQFRTELWPEQHMTLSNAMELPGS